MKAGPWRTRDPWIAALVAACMSYVLGDLLAGRWQLTPVDDAFISLRYAANWAGGAGLCFNPGERVEGYTNFLLVAIETVALWCGADGVRVMTLVGRLSLACIGGVVAAFAVTHLFPRRTLVAIAAGTAVALNPVLICWANSGMESCLYALLILISTVILVKADKIDRDWTSAGLLALASMARPEAAALLPVMSAVVYLKRRSIRAVTVYVSVFLAGFGVYFVCRAWYFGYPFPNTFYSKLDYGSILLVKRGLLYVWDFIRAAPLLVILLLLALMLLAKAERWVRCFMLVAAWQMLIVIYEGGDHFAMFRFMVPILPLACLVAFYPCVHGIRRYDLSPAVATTATLLTLGAIVLSGITVSRQTQRTDDDPGTQLDQFIGECAHARDWAVMGRWFHQHAPADASLCCVAIGAVGYYSGLKIIDPHGIVDETIAHKRTKLGRGYAGHEKFDVEYTVARRPGYFLLVHVFTPRAVPEGALNLMVWGAFNKALLREPSLQEEYRYETLRVGDRYLNLHIRNDLPPLGYTSAGKM